MNSEYASLYVYKSFLNFAFVMGLIILLSSVFGILSVRYANDSKKCCFLAPFVPLSLTGAIILIIFSGITGGSDRMVMESIKRACSQKIGPGMTLATKVSEEYTKLVDRMMCSSQCLCPDAVADTWRKVKPY